MCKAASMHDKNIQSRIRELEVAKNQLITFEKEAE